MTPSPLVWLAAAALACGCGRGDASAASGAASAGAADGPTARLEGAADSAFTGVRVTTSFATRSQDRRCQTWSLGYGEYVPRDDVVEVRAAVEGGRWAVDAPLAWSGPPGGPSGCGWEPTSVSVWFERGGRVKDPKTRFGLFVGLGGPLLPPYGTSEGPARPTPRPPVPDSVTVVCRPIETVRPVAVQPVACLERMVAGQLADLPLFDSTPSTLPSPLYVEARYEPSYAEEDTTGAPLSLDDLYGTGQ